jgi:hypothetical protein
MRVRLVFVPPGGGEADYQLEFELPSIPQPGDYISISRPGSEGDAMGTETFTVRRSMWELEYPNLSSMTAKPGEHGKAANIWVECEFARGAFNSKNHERACNGYDGRGKPVAKHEATAY